MKNYIFISICIFILSACTSNRYLLIDKGPDSKFLIQKIEESAQKGLISETPMLVIDGHPYRYDVELKKGLRLTKADINQIDILEHETGTNLYGSRGKKGVVLIMTFTGEKLYGLTKLEGNVLILCEGNKITKKELWEINPMEVDSIEILKSKDEVVKYTTDNIQVVVVIKLMKK